MRSVYFLLTGCTQLEVAKYLYAIADASGDDNWCYPQGAPLPVLFLGFNDDLEAETDPEDMALLKIALGKAPDVVVMADVSGRVDGTAEVKDFAGRMLRAFHGVAWDDYTDHCWTLIEIQTGVRVLEHPFFDHRGWDREENGKTAA